MYSHLSICELFKLSKHLKQGGREGGRESERERKRERKRGERERSGELQYILPVFALSCCLSTSRG